MRKYKNKTNFKKCKQCGKEFLPKSKRNVFCKSWCNYEFAKNLVEKVNPQIGKSHLGAVGELLVSADLMKKGYEVFRALSPHSYCDLVAIKDDIVTRYEVRTGSYFVTANKGTTLHYSKGKSKGKIIAVITYKDNKIHYIE